MERKESSLRAGGTAEVLQWHSKPGVEKAASKLGVENAALCVHGHGLVFFFFLEAGVKEVSLEKAGLCDFPIRSIWVQ